MSTVPRILLLVSIVGCKPPPEAPEELDDLARYLYREWDAEDPLVMEAGVSSLDSFLAELTLDANINDRSFQMEPPEEEDLADVGRPEGRNAADMLGVSVAAESRWAVGDHARLQAEEDQLPAEPTAKVYVRTTQDADCFLAQTCDVMTTVNEVRRENFLLAVDFTLYKDFRWVMVGEERAMVSRSWTDQDWPAENENKGIWQSHSLDVWIPKGETTWRWQLIWSESDVGVSDESLIVGTLKVSTDNIFEKGDQAIGEIFYGE